MSDSFDSKDDKTPPPYRIVDPETKKYLDDLWRQLGKLQNSFWTHRTVVVGEDGKGGTLAALDDAMASMQSSAEKTAAAASGWWKWVLGQALVFGLAILSAWVLLDRRVTTVETRQDEIRGRIDRVERTFEKLDDTLEKLDGRLDAFADRMPRNP